MPKLGEFIGALLSDAVQARVRADIEAVKIAEVYSAHELLKHLPVPRFRMPDITVDLPVLVTSVEGLNPDAGGRSFDQPTPAEVAKVVRAALKESDVRLPRIQADKVAASAAQRVERLFEEGPGLLLTPGKVSREVSASVAAAVKSALKREVPAERLEAVRLATDAGLRTVLATKMLGSPHLQVAVTAGEIKDHADNDSVVRLRLTITEDAYEVVSRDDGPGYYLTPE